MSRDTPKNIGTKFTSRRKFLKGAAGIGLLSASATNVKAGTSENSNQAKTKAKNCIFLVVDGMGRGTLSLANDYALFCTGRPLNWLNLLHNKKVTTALQNTASASSLVTDSAAAGSAWATGKRIRNGQINISMEGESLEPFFLKAKALGKSIGLVSTARITHATPASFVASVANRDDEDTIAQQYLEHEVDLLMGGGARHFIRPGCSLLEDFKQKGYSCFKTKSSMFKNDNASKILGLFGDTHFPYAVDRKHSKQYFQVPKLEEMFQFSLSHLSRNKSGFCLQLEAARVDHAGHAKDMASIVEEQLEFDRCIPIAVDFVDKNPDTLLIITTDHGTGGCQLNGIGHRYEGVYKTMGRINKIKASYEFLAEKLHQIKKPEKQLFSSLLGIGLNEKDLNVIQSMMDQTYSIFPFGYREKTGQGYEGYSHDYLAANLGSYFERYFYEQTGVAWTSDAHTSELVDLIAYGACSESIPQFIQNYELNGLLRNALKI